jgi:hypothetical protein
VAEGPRRAGRSRRYGGSIGARDARSLAEMREVLC